MDLGEGLPKQITSLPLSGDSQGGRPGRSNRGDEPANVSAGARSDRDPPSPQEPTITDTSMSDQVDRSVADMFASMPSILKPCLSDICCEEGANQVTAANWVAEEMWNFGRNRPQLQGSPTVGILEVYCSAKSQLTKQCRKTGLTAARFGKDHGDLSTPEGRQILYRQLFGMKPRDIWVSPKCTAWCKWSQFNASRSPEAAEQVRVARDADRVHLLLCAALLEFQQAQGPEHHFHVEQPRGPHMLFQDELYPIRQSLHCAHLDMREAGQLIHPESGLLLQKQTEDWTTSQTMHHRLSALKCRKDHCHDWVAGTYQIPHQGRGLVSRVTELYTAMFATKVCRCILESAKCREIRSLPQSATACTIEPDAKRMRLRGKQSVPASWEERLQQCLNDISQQAPRVGKQMICEGILFERVQELFPEAKIHCLDVCRGVDCPMEASVWAAPESGKPLHVS